MDELEELDELVGCTREGKGVSDDRRRGRDRTSGTH